MRLSASEDSVVQNCIEKLLYAHIQNPFHILREAGVVAELRRLLVERNCFPPATPSFLQFPGRSAACAVNRLHVNTEVLRVQMEIQVPLKGLDCLSDSLRHTGVFASTKVLDVGVLSTSPKLNCARNGAGDVVQQVDVCSLSAAVEVKASPSVSPEQRGHYVKDIWALLELAQDGVAGYFILLDKTSSLYGSPAHGLKAGHAMAWDDKYQQDILVRRGQLGDFDFTSLHDAGLEISSSQPIDRPFVQIWRVDGTNGAYAPQRLFAACAC